MENQARTPSPDKYGVMIDGQFFPIDWDVEEEIFGSNPDDLSDCVFGAMINGQFCERYTDVEYATYSSDPDDYLECIVNLEYDDFYGTHYREYADESEEDSGDDSDLEFYLNQPIYASNKVIVDVVNYEEDEKDQSSDEESENDSFHSVPFN